MVDRLRQLGRAPVAVNFGTRSAVAKYSNTRTRLWGELAEWLMRRHIRASRQATEQQLTLAKAGLQPPATGTRGADEKTFAAEGSDHPQRRRKPGGVGDLARERRQGAIDGRAVLSVQRHRASTWFWLSRR